MSVALNPFERAQLALQILLEPSTPSPVELEAQILQLQGQITTLQNQNNSLQGQVSSLNSQVTQLQSTNNTLTNANTTLTSEINNLNTQVSSLNSEITSLNGQVGSLTATLNAWTGAFPSLSAAQVESEINGLNSQVVSLDSEVNNLTAVLSTWTSTFPSQTAQNVLAQINAYISEINTLNTEILTAVQNAINAQLLADLNVLNPLLNTITSNYYNIDGNFNTVSSDITSEIGTANDLNTLLGYGSFAPASMLDDYNVFEQVISSFNSFYSNFGAFQNAFSPVTTFWTQFISSSVYSTIRFDYNFGQFGDPNSPLGLPAAPPILPATPDISSLAGIFNNSVVPRANILPGNAAVAIPVSTLQNDINARIPTYQNQIQQYINALGSVTLTAIPPSGVTL